MNLNPSNPAKNRKMINKMTTAHQLLSCLNQNQLLIQRKPRKYKANSKNRSTD